MRVLFLDPVATMGGAERCLLDLAASLRAVRPSVEMGLVVGGAGPLVEEASRLGMDVTVLPLPRSLSRAGDSAISGLTGIVKSAPSLAVASGALAAYAVKLDRAVRAFGPTVIHSNGIKMHLLSALLPNRGAPLVWHVRDFLGQRAIMASVLRLVSPRAHGLLAISKSVVEDTARTLRRDDVTLAYDAIDTASFAPDGPRVDLDALAGMAPASKDVVRIGLIATYARWKGQEVFIDAAARYMKARGPAARFFIVGGTTYDTDASQFTVQELRARIVDRGLADVFGLVRFQAAPDRVYRALDIAVHASTRPEPFGRTIAEAMTCGRALIAAREGGAAELVEDDVDALAV